MVSHLRDADVLSRQDVTEIDLASVKADPAAVRDDKRRVVKRVGQILQAEISAEDLLGVLNSKVRAGAPVAANRLRALVSRIFTFGAGQRLVAPTANPVIGVKKPTKETTRDR